MTVKAFANSWKQLLSWTVGHDNGWALDNGVVVGVLKHVKKQRLMWEEV